MNLRDVSGLRTDHDAARVYGQPCETADGTMVIPVARARGGALGVFVAREGEATWVPAVDGTRIALMGILVGLVSSVLAGVAMIRRPPWPDLHGDISKRP